MKRQILCILCMMLLLLTGCASAAKNVNMAATKNSDTEVIIGNITFGWLPERMQEAERIEKDSFCYILFLGEQDSTDDYVTFFYKELEPTGSGKIVGTRLEIKDLEQEALDNGGELLKEVLEGADNSVSWTTVDGDENGENRYMFCIRTHGDGWQELSQIIDHLIIDEISDMN
ncbi:MAG: hypothetical protein IKU27_05710 [Clostridia bacterium]|nr:hypothetical protein [Clostridia bacterium]